MNYKDKNNKDKLIKFKDKTLKEIDAFLTSGITGSSDADYKKSALISYWLSDFHKYLNWERNFSPQKLKRYERGDIIKVNLGFNIGNEQGGLHYAVVLDNNNAISSGVITVIPLSSKKKGKEIHGLNVDLGNDIYTKLKIKFDEKRIEVVRRVNEAHAIIDILSKIPYTDMPVDDFDKQLEKFKQRLSESEKELHSVKKVEKEINQMKAGSVGLVSQITTVSKMRIYDPRNDGGALSGIKLSPAGLDLINEKIKELYLKSEK